MITSELILSAEVRAMILHTLHWIATAIEVLGVAVIIAGVVVASASSVLANFIRASGSGPFAPTGLI